MLKKEKNQFDWTHEYWEKLNTKLEDVFKEAKSIEEQIRWDERKKVFLEVTDAINWSSWLISYIEIFEAIFKEKYSEEKEEKLLEDIQS